MTVICLPDSSVGYSFFTMVAHGGAMTDPHGKGGVRSLLCSGLLAGAGELDRVGFREELDWLGAELEIRTNRHHTVIEGEVLSRNKKRLFELLRMALTSPRLDAAELETLRKLSLASLQQIQDQDDELAAFLHGQFVWEAHPYARSVRGCEESIQSITREDVCRSLEQLRSDGLWIAAAAGDVDKGELETELSELGLPIVEQTPPTLSALDDSQWDGIEVLLIDRRDRNQVQVLWGQPCVSANHCDAFPLKVANTAFGGTFTSTLMQEIREKRGWTYGAYSSMSADRFTGLFAMNYHVENKNAVAAVELGRDLLRTWRDTGLSEEKLAFAQDALAHGFPFLVESAEKRLARSIEGVLLDRPDDYLERYVERVRAVTVDQVKSALKTHISGRRMRLTVLGPAPLLEPGLAGLEGVSSIRVRPYSKPLGEVLS